MKSILVSLTAASCILFTGAAQADQALATAKGCMACHDIATKKLGPSYKDVAKKYAGQKDAEAKLTKKVLEGGSGVWGAIPMPANKTMGVTEADAKKLVAWILGLK
ncbi:Cytochrome c-552 [Georgfuchsia toluolica]|uniref:Cytochrome c-552 n=1 Tax=Georgfuchsia toluolica TaxID=424218 RepID=A0A916NIL4_9PROT|nr:c-type cytochrome [Georgfuchsia toluolica]CAG4884681.1 Cytochrome c-552 [Georgfuchsia toluolica]